MKTSSLRLLLTSLTLAPALIAQTWTGATSLDWDDAANWNPATVPAGTGATATFTAAGLDPQYSNSISMTTGRTLGGIAFAADAGPVTLYAGHETDPTTLVLDGSGLANLSAFQQRVWLSPTVFTYPGATNTLEFRNHATVAGDVRLIAIGDNRHIDFHDQASAGTATIASYNTDFYEQSTAGNATFDQSMSAVVTFHDQSTAGAATLPGYNGSVIFVDSASAGSAKLQRPQAHGSSAMALFRDHSTAGNSDLYLYNVEFSGEATAATARINTSGTQEYSSHGAYSTHTATTIFRDASHAGDAAIAVNSLATLSFLDSSSAERANITSTGRVTFENRSTFADTRLQAGSGTYYGYGGYNEPAPTITVGDVIFKDQATGGNGRIEITSAATKLDFSGLYDVGGTTGRALLPAGTTPAAIAPDDARAISLGAITNTSPGGTIFLGATILSVGTANQDMTLSALIRDTGGAYGSAAGAALRGGSLVKVGDGTLTISNPDNDYTGVTTIVRGAVNLAGGRIQGGNIFANARLTGTGVVRGQVVNAGLVSPGNSVGTITVTGDYTQAASGTLRIELVSPSSYDRLVVTGTATLGGTLQLVTPGDFVPVGSVSFPFLSAGAISGTFATVTPATGLGAALSSQVLYGATGVSVQLTQHPFASFGGDSPAATALGAHLDATLAGATGDYRALIAGLNTLATGAEINTALTALAPDRYSTLASNAFLSAAVHQSAQDRRFAAARAEADAHGFGFFFEGSQHRSEFDAAPGLTAAESTLSGATGGVAWNGNGFTFGAAVTREKGDADLDEIGSTADLESTTPAVFFQYSTPAFFVSTSAAFSSDDYDLRRRIVYPGVDLTATGQTSGQRQDFALTIGRDFRSGSWAFTPQAGLLASRWELDGFTEAGAAGANLTLPDQSLRSLRTRLALDVAALNPTFVPRFSIAWLHETETDRSIHAAFASGPAYVAPGRPAARDLIQASAGFDWKVGRRAALYATAAGAWGDAESITLDLSAGFRWQF